MTVVNQMTMQDEQPLPIKMNRKQRKKAVPRIHGTGTTKSDISNKKRAILVVFMKTAVEEVEAVEVVEKVVVTTPVEPKTIRSTCTDHG
jgi:hypothetical protein